MKLAIEYTTQIWQEGEQFIAHAMPLDVASSGGSPDEARKALDEAVHLFLSTASEHGTLEQVLEDAGYLQVGDSWQSPPWLAVERGAATLTV
jgi:predicted RNase H-like HicB family nuclease